MRTIPNHIFFLLGLAAANLCALHAYAGTDSLFAVSADMLGYMDNAEYFNDYSEGQTYLGALAKIRLVYRPAAPVSFSLGMHMRKDFGDDRFFSDARPLLRVRYDHNGFSMVLGELAGLAQHGLLDAMLREQVAYDPGVEEGLQILYKGSIVDQDLWMNYYALNTAQQREHLDIGDRTTVAIGPLYFSAMGLADHHGGQLFDPPNDPVRENVTGALGVTFRCPLQGRIREIGAEEFAVGSFTDFDRANGPNHQKGYGSLTHVWMMPLGFNVGLRYFKGHDYETWQGDSLYEAKNYYSHFEVSRLFVFSRDIYLDFGFRFEFVDTDFAGYFEHAENRVWVRLGGSMEKFLAPNQRRQSQSAQ
jgi:hypothetical protein